MLLEHLQGLSSTLGSILAVTLLLQVSQLKALTPSTFSSVAPNPLTITLATCFPPQVLVLLGLRYLQTALEGLGGIINGEGETQGYLFPGGLKDILKTTWLQGGLAHKPAPEEAPPEEEPPKEVLAEA